ncbi:MAG: DUF3810 domain-containing protein [Anaerolineaceae bacterium]|nr:MAG: DUF3810 domain-containing protein [Anaerolineaceae bacterium]
MKGGCNLRDLLRLKRNYLLILFPLSILFIWLARKSSFFVEQIYALHVYRWLSQFISLITGLIPISMAELLILILPIILVTLLIKFIIHLVKDKDNIKINVAKGLINILCSLSVVLFSFTILGGLNYYRYSFTYYSNLEIDKYSVEELYDLTKHLAEQANDFRSRIPKVDDNDVFDLSMSNYQLAKEANKAMKNLSKEYPVFKGRYASPKPVLFSPLMSHAEITGIFIPFTMEANVNVDITDYAIPYTMLHEMAHQRGFMREDEANYIAYLAGISSDNIELMYSSTMLALISSGNALYSQDTDLYFEIRDIYSEGIVKDIRANSEYWVKYEDTVISTVSNKINDTYLKANAQADGVKSYGRMVDLLLAKYRAEILGQ